MPSVTTQASKAFLPLPIPTEWDIKKIKECDSGVRVRRLIELAIVRHLATTLIAAGHTITVDDGGDEPVKASKDIAAILDAVFAVDEATLYVHQNGAKKPTSWISLILGNDGWDVICDHTTDLEEVMKPTTEYADAMGEWC